MDVQRRGVFVLFVLLVPVSCDTDDFFSEPITCYVLDGILIIYCLIATAFYFREKFSDFPPEAVAEPVSHLSENNGAVYQEPERPKDTDPYQVLEPTKRKKKGGRKKKSAPTSAQETEREPYESLMLTPVPPLSSR